MIMFTNAVAVDEDVFSFQQPTNTLFFPGMTFIFILHGDTEFLQTGLQVIHGFSLSELIFKRCIDQVFVFFGIFQTLKLNFGKVFGDTLSQFVFPS